MEVGLVVPRQNGKGAILEARELAGLFLFGEELIIHSAHLFDTSLEAFRRILGLIEDNPHFKSQLKRVVRSHGEEGIELKSGQRLRFKTRTAGGGRGLSGDVVILDEAYNLPGEAMAALMPTLSARPNPQVWYTSSAPLRESVTLRRICQRGRAGEDRNLAYEEWCADDDADSDDSEALAAGNPGLGIRISAAFSESERGALDDEDYRRERLGIWLPDETASVLDMETWLARADDRSAAEDPVAFALDVKPDRSATSISVAGRRPDGLMHGELVERRSGTRGAVERVVELCEKWNVCAVLLDPVSPAGAFIPALEEAGIKVKPDLGETQLHVVGPREMAQACGAIYDLIANDQIRHLNQPELNRAVETVRTRRLGDAWAFARKDSDGDISPLVSLTLALLGHAMYGSVDEASVYEGRDLVVL